MKEDKAWKVVTDFHQAGLADKDVAILSYAKCLTISPANIEHRIVDQLKNYGFSDESLLLINLTVSYFNFVNRLAQGLGVELEDYWNPKAKEQVEKALTVIIKE